MLQLSTVTFYVNLIVSRKVHKGVRRSHITKYSFDSGCLVIIA